MEFGTDILGLRFLTGDLALMKPYEGQYNFILVSLSYFFAFFGSYAGLTIAQQIPVSNSRAEKAAWLGAGSISIGAAIWLMHFVGMLAFELPIEVSYDLSLTVISAIPAVLAGIIVLLISCKSRVNLFDIAIGGLFLGAGIGVMHFTGMGAMRAGLSMGYDPALFAMSILVAVLLACTALSAKSRIERLNIAFNLKRSNMAAALIMGLAISGMHYTAMTAVTFYEGSLCATITGPVVSGGFLSDPHAEFVFMLLLLIVVGFFARKSAAKTALLSAILDNSVEGVIVTDRLGLITRISSVAEEIFGYDAGELIGQNLSKLIPEDIREKHAGHMAGFQTGNGVEIMGTNREVLALKKDGTTIPIEIGVAEVSVGSETRFSATLRDITERKQMEEMHIEALVEIQKMLTKQQQLNDTQRQFVAMASHEFRTPLSVIDMTAQRMVRGKDEPVSEKTKEGVEKIRNSVNHMTRLMESMLTAARMEAGTVSVDIADCDISALVQLTCVRHQEIAKTHTIACESAEAPQTIRADSGAVEQILTNMLSNAVKYSPKGSNIDVCLRQDGGEVVLSVRDHGLGIPEEELPKMFERFFRASTSTGITGTGIGLNLAKELVEMHNGTIMVESEENKGSIFTVRLPIAGPANPQEQIAMTA